MPPLVVAHRGLSSAYPENTLLAVKQAMEVGSDLVEIDVQFSADGHVMVMHDESVDRTTNHSGKLSEYTLKELKEMDAGSSKSKEFAGEKIPTLDEVLELVVNNKYGAKLLIELKWKWISSEGLFRPYKNLESEVVRLIQARRAQKFVVVQSFVETYLSNIKRLDAEIPVHLLVFPWRLTSSIAKIDYVDSFNILHLTASRSFVDKIHGMGKKVYTWTVDDEEEMKYFCHLGIDGVITNKPEEMKSIIASFDESSYVPSNYRLVLDTSLLVTIAAAMFTALMARRMKLPFIATLVLSIACAVYTPRFIEDA